MKKTILALLLAVTGLAQAQCDDWCCGSFEVIGEALYLRPSTCDLNYAILDERNFENVDSTDRLPQGTERGVCPDYDWGFRVGLGYVMDCSCYDARITYTRLDTNNRSKMADVEASNGGIWITYAHPNYADRVLFTAVDTTFLPAIASERFHTEYNAIDLELGHRGMKGCDLWLRTHVGLHYLSVRNNRRVDYQGTIYADAITPDEFSNWDGVYSIHGHNKVWGIGPRFGFDLSYNLLCGFGIGAHGGLGILAGETRSKMFESVVQSDPETTLVDEDLNVCQRTRCLVFPEVDAALGVNYMWCCGCCSVLIEFGYEWRTYVNALDHTVFNSVGGTSSAKCTSYNLDGIYLSFVLQL